MAERNKRTVRDLRRGNRARVLQRLYFEGPLSRQELGPATGLSSGSISNVVSELIAEGVLEEAGVVDSDGGRPRTLLRVAPGSGLLIGIDIGETRVRVELFDLSLTELARTERLLAQHGYDVERVVAHVRTGVADVLREADADPARLLGVGVGVPGIIEQGSDDGTAGAIVHGQTIGWSAVPFEKLLRESVELPLGVPLFIDNGAKTLGQAEMWFGGGRGAREAAVALIGSGVGACVVHAATPDENARSSALEWGHTTVRIRGGAAAVAPSAAWRRTRARRPCASAGRRQEDRSLPMRTTRPRWPPCWPRHSRVRTAPNPTRWRSPFSTTPPSIWARPSPI